MKIPRVIGLLFLLISAFFDSYAFASSPAITSAKSKKVWSAKEILLEKSLSKQPEKNKFCNGGRFEPCICWPNVSRLLKYRPAVSECGGRAGVMLTGKYTRIYSVVVRDTENRDRWPASGYNGCSAYETNVLALNKCSAFKVQKKMTVVNGKKKGILHCFGESGYSPIFAQAVRLTLKLSDVPNSHNDPIMRFCLRSPRLRLN